MVVLAVLGTLTLLVMPEMRIYLRNVKIRKTAESFATDVMNARAEAIRTNKTVVFRLTESDAQPSSGDWRDAAASTAGQNWLSYVLTGTAGGTTFTASLLNFRPATEVSGEPVKIIALDRAPGEFAFNGLGATNVPATAAYRFTDAAENPNCALTDKAIRCLQVEVSAGGKTRICEPGRTNAGATTDTRACTVGG
jgi:Tfp pilus assembly protein FimT